MYHSIVLVEAAYAQLYYSTVLVEAAKSLAPLNVKGHIVPEPQLKSMVHGIYTHP